MHNVKEDGLIEGTCKLKKKKKKIIVCTSLIHRRYAGAVYVFTSISSCLLRAFGKGQNFQNPIRCHVCARVLSRPKCK